MSSFSGVAVAVPVVKQYTSVRASLFLTQRAAVQANSMPRLGVHSPYVMLIIVHTAKRRRCGTPSRPLREISTLKYRATRQRMLLYQREGPFEHVSSMPKSGKPPRTDDVE